MKSGFLGCLMLFMVGSATAQELLPLRDGEIPAGCSCRFGTVQNQPLVFWSQEGNRLGALRSKDGIVPLRVHKETYIPQRDAPRVGDRIAVQLVHSDWSVQLLGTVERTCAPKAKKCAGTFYKGRIDVLWNGRDRRALDAWGWCGCP